MCVCQVLSRARVSLSSLLAFSRLISCDTGEERRKKWARKKILLEEERKFFSLFPACIGGDITFHGILFMDLFLRSCLHFSFSQIICCLPAATFQHKIVLMASYGAYLNHDHRKCSIMLQGGIQACKNCEGSKKA